MYNGYLLKFIGPKGADEFPESWIQFDSYKITPHTRIDKDSGVSSANGVLHRTVLPHQRSKIEFNIPPMYDDKYEEIVSFFHSHFNNETERKVKVEYYDFDTGSYSSGDFYMPDFTAQIHMCKENGRLLMDATRFALIEY